VQNPVPGPVPAADAILVTGLTVAYQSKAGWLQAVRDVSFDLKSGEILAIVGETGSGKSSTAAAMIRMLPSNGRVEAGQVFFEGKNLLELPEREMRRLRGESIAYVPQQPTSAFNQIGRAHV